jgi:hypothetical protein
MFDVVENVLPVFLLILAGWLIVSTGYLKPEAGEALSDFVFKVSVPVLLFRTIALSDFHGAFPLRLWLAYFSGVAVTWALAHMISVRIFGSDQRTGTVAGVSSAFANTVFIGLPLVDRTVGPEGLVALSILIAIHLPVMMIASSVLIERAEKRDTGQEREGFGALMLRLTRSFFRNPLVFGILGGLIWHGFGLPLSGMAKTLTDEISAIAGPAALLSLGMAMRRHGGGESGGMIIAASLLKLFVMPAVVLGFSTLFGLDPQWRKALVLTAAVPTGVNAWLIATQFGVAQKLAASTTTLTTALGVVSVTFWAWLLG